MDKIHPSYYPQRRWDQPYDAIEEKLPPLSCKMTPPLHPNSVLGKISQKAFDLLMEKDKVIKLLALALINKREVIIFTIVTIGHWVVERV